ncbi:MAG TPA: N-acetyl-alpha-D-glucosaminyl L-malate synthase BshA [Bryobacteraceae bacterium]|nr:N-acetyl-alpha-D-glucosaminyl L-malate synthase BshA [Bryobacteraceae bacterium]
MKIGITCYPTYGGSGIVATELGLELALRGHEIHFISYANPIRLDAGTPGINYHEVEVSSYPLFQYPPYCLALASRMAEVAERYHLDLLHVHYAIPHSISALLARQMLAPLRRVPFVTTLHGTDITLVGSDRSYFPITKFSIEQSDGITSISGYLQRRTVEFFGVQNHIEVIHNFVNIEVYKPIEKELPPEPILLHISNFRPVKRVLDCIRILAAVRKHVPAKLWMAGDGPDRSPAEALARDLGVQPYVTFLGKQDHVERLIPRADVLLLPSELEAFGLAALEAMACGLPPIATNAGGVPELVTNGHDGFLEAVGDVDAQASRAVELLTNPPLYKRMRAAARATAEQRFATSLVIPRYERFYEQVLAGNLSPVGGVQQA